jgi:GntR family transcriptional regulator/MocR family aminotransferase
MTTWHLAVDRSGGPPLYGQIYDGLRRSILDGLLRPGQRVPSTRSLAVDLAISRQPVLAAYEQLLHEGYLEGRHGSGTYVGRALPDDFLSGGERGRTEVYATRKPWFDPSACR